MTAEQQRVIDELEQQLAVNPRLLHLSLKDWLTYEGMIQDLGATFLGLQMKEDSVVPLTYKTLPVIMRANEVKELIKELVRQNAPVPSVTPPTGSGPVPRMTKEERELETPTLKTMGNLISDLTQPVVVPAEPANTWWNGDQVVTEPTPKTPGAPDASPSPTN